MQILLFAGTSEGRRLAEFMEENEIQTIACVATAYGEAVLPEGKYVRVLAGRLSEGEMEELMGENNFSWVIDATHPYAAEVTENIKQAANARQIKYLRVIREELGSGDCLYVENVQAAAALLNSLEGRVLITTGSKELEAFTSVRDYETRLYPRILPMAEAVEKCERLGFAPKNLICMQGPFSEELNIALLKQTGAAYLVTKDSGRPGGMEEKLTAAKKAGVRVIVIGRPSEEQGFSLEEVQALLLPPSKREKKWQEILSLPRFPLFVDIAGKSVVVVGAGKIATRRIQTLLRFCGQITVIAPQASPEVERLAREGTLRWLAREYQKGDLAGAYLAVAAACVREVNWLVGQEAEELGILCSVADSREECSFYFPAVAESGKLVAGIVGDGTDHGKVRRAAARIREILEEEKGKSDER